MAVSFSADGLRWSEAIECPEINAHGDTHNVAFWAPDMGKHIVFTRINAGDNTRQVARTESKDFVNWTKAKVVLKGDDPLKQTHDLVVFPTSGIYIGLLGVMEFIERSNYNVKQHVELFGMNGRALEPEAQIKEPGERCSHVKPDSLNARVDNVHQRVLFGLCSPLGLYIIAGISNPSAAGTVKISGVCTLCSFNTSVAGSETTRNSSPSFPRRVNEGGVARFE